MFFVAGCVGRGVGGGPRRREAAAPGSWQLGREEGEFGEKYEVPTFRRIFEAFEGGEYIYTVC